MNIAGPLTAPTVTTKSAVSLRTWPVGPPATVTTKPSFTPVLPLYRVDLLVPSSETHHGEVAPWEIPQPLTRSGSNAAASPGTSDWSLWTLYRFSAFGFCAATGSATPSSNPRLATSARAAVNEIAVSTRKVVLIELGIVLIPLESHRRTLSAA